jgi:DNA anti-recombination protein RmuC
LKQRLEQIAQLHRELSDALDAGDIEHIEQLVRLRQDKLAGLAQSYHAATAEQRQASQAALKRLLSEERGLMQRCVNLRDELYGHLTAGSHRKTSADHADSQHQFLDCQA